MQCLIDRGAAQVVCVGARGAGERATEVLFGSLSPDGSSMQGLHRVLGSTASHAPPAASPASAPAIHAVEEVGSLAHCPFSQLQSTTSVLMPSFE